MIYSWRLWIMSSIMDWNASKDSMDSKTPFISQYPQLHT